MDSRFQLGHTPCVLPDRRILLTWNRRALDFTEQERHIFYFIGMRLGVISRHIAEKQRLEMSWQGLCQFVDVRTGAGAASSLATQDVHLLTALLKTGTRKSIAGAMGIRRDSVDKRLGAIRERLGLENHYQLLSALAELTKLSLEPGKSSTDHEIGVTR